MDYENSVSMYYGPFLYDKHKIISAMLATWLMLSSNDAAALSAYWKSHLFPVPQKTTDDVWMVLKDCTISYGEISATTTCNSAQKG